MSYTPVDVTSSFGFGPGGNASPPGGMQPIKFGGNWFYLALDGNTGATLQAFKSTDNQASWTSIATVTVWDGVHFPNMAGTAFDGAHTLVAFWYKNDGTTVMHLVAFDCNAGTFGSVINTPVLGSGSGISPQSVFIRPTGTYCIFYGVAASPPAGPFEFREYTPGGASWSSIVNVWAGVASPSSTGFAAMQSTGVFHVLGEAGGTHIVYVQITTGNALNGLQDLGAGSFLSGTQTGAPVLDEVNGNVMWPALKSSFFYLLVGSGGLSSPTFGSLTQQDNTTALDFFPPTLEIIGTELYGVGIANSGNQLWLFKTPAAAITPTGAIFTITQVFDGGGVTIPGWTSNTLAEPFIAPNGANTVLYFNSSGPGAFSGDTFEYSLAQAAPVILAYHYRVLTSTSLSPSSATDIDWTLGGVQL